MTKGDEVTCYTPRTGHVRGLAGPCGTARLGDSRLIELPQNPSPGIAKSKNTQDAMCVCVCRVPCEARTLPVAVSAV